jgi:sugar phosphate isomerase/epimerase
MKLCVSTYSFHNLIANGKMSLLDTASQARQMGFEAVELVHLGFPADETAQFFAGKFKNECERVKINIANYAVGSDFLNCQDNDFGMEIERLKAEVDVAGILGVQTMRHDVTGGFPAQHQGGRSFDDALPILVKGCKAVTGYAKRFGIRTMVENHGYFCQDSERVEKLICAVGSDNFGALVDVGNFLCVDENPEKAVGRLAQYAFFAHVKDFHTKSGNLPHPGKGWFTSRGGNYLRGSIAGHGDVPVLQCLGILKRSGYDGFLSLEFEGLEETLTGISLGLENVKKYMDILA